MHKQTPRTGQHGDLEIAVFVGELDPLPTGDDVVGRVRVVGFFGNVSYRRAGDFNGDGNDEAAVLPVRGQAKDIVFLEVPKLSSRKERISFKMVPWNSSSPGAKKVGERFRTGKKLWTAQTLRTANGVVADLNRDGIDELIFNPGVYSLEGGVHQTVKFPEPFKVPSYDQFYNMRMVAVGDLTESPGNEIVLLERCEIRLLDKQGQQLGAARASFGFTDVIYEPGSPLGDVLLGSSPNGDDNLYRLRFDAGWEEDVASLEPRSSRPLVAGFGSRWDTAALRTARSRRPPRSWRRLRRPVSVSSARKMSNWVQSRITSSTTSAPFWNCVSSTRSGSSCGTRMSGGSTGHPILVSNS